MAYIVYAMLEHQYSFDSKTERKSRINLRIITNALEYIGMNHTRTQNFYPAGIAAKPTALTPTNKTVYRHINARFNKREVIAAETHLALGPKKALGKLK